MLIDTDINVFALSLIGKNVTLFVHPLHVVIKNTFGVQPLKSLLCICLLICGDPDVCRLLMGEVSVV